MVLPKNVHLLTLEPWHENELLVRFEHILEKNEDSRYSKYVQFNVRDVLEDFNIVDMRETTLDGNAWLDEHQRMEFVPDADSDDYNSYATFSRDAKNVHLLNADKPLLGAEYSSESLKTEQLGAESNRIKRSKRFKLRRQNRLSTQEEENQEGALPLESSDRNKYLIELGAMEIRTFVVYLAK